MKIKITNSACLTKRIHLVLACFVAGMMMVPFNGSSQKKAAADTKASAYSGNYRNVFAEAGFPQDSIGKKIEQAYHDLFEGPNKV